MLMYVLWACDFSGDHSIQFWDVTNIKCVEHDYQQILDKSDFDSDDDIGPYNDDVAFMKENAMCALQKAMSTIKRQREVLETQESIISTYIEKLALEENILPVLENIEMFLNA